MVLGTGTAVGEGVAEGSRVPVAAAVKVAVGPGRADVAETTAVR